MQIWPMVALEPLFKNKISSISSVQHPAAGVVSFGVK